MATWVHLFVGMVIVPVVLLSVYICHCKIPVADIVNCHAPVLPPNGDQLPPIIDDTYVVGLIQHSKVKSLVPIAVTDDATTKSVVVVLKL